MRVHSEATTTAAEPSSECALIAILIDCTRKVLLSPTFQARSRESMSSASVEAGLRSRRFRVRKLGV